MFGRKTIAGAVLALCLGAASAPAATITFDFTGQRGSGQTYSQTVGGLTLLVDGARYGRTFNIFGNSRVTWNGNGLGARSGATDTNSALDGSGFNEILTFLFSQVVKIETITFDAIARRSRADGFVNGSYVGTATVPVSYDASGNSFLADLYGLGARTDASSFRISSITVSTVPLPAAGLLLVSALGVMGLMRRRRSAVAAV